MAALFSVFSYSHIEAAALKKATKPNFVFILVDDLGWTDLGCLGSTFYETPPDEIKKHVHDLLDI
ncbi:MAG: hypothetical protein PVH19_03230 [Planctomycetia bacterium]